MKYFGLVWKNVWRKKIRTSLTVLSVLVAFLLFALLSAVAYAFRAGSDLAAADRLVVIHKVSLINPLPIAYENRIAATDGVAAVTHSSWFGGYYQEPRNQFPQFPTEPREYFAMYPELEIPPEQLEAFAKTRTGVVVGQQLADTYAFKVGDRIPLISTIWPNAEGGQNWEFDIVGIMSSNDARQPTNFMLMNYEYFNETRQYGTDLVGWYILRTARDADPVAVANAIDEQFANSSDATETSTEAAFAQSFAKQFGNIQLMVTLILGAVFFTLLLVAGNTMSQSVRERISELAVLKTLGFTDRKVLGVVLSESILIMLMGGLIGLLLGWLVVQGAAAAMGAFLPGIYFSPQAMLTALGIMVAAGIAAGIFPALKAMRLPIVEALARA
ncbi:MAG TPA: ABC transporter permease [Woeseiaceae bacterium]|nr:ABC transporter permease [Woeseiaceae bacterium]